jgi:hypothetical protein
MSKAQAAAKAAEPEVVTGAEAGPIATLLAAQCKARESGIYFNTWEVVPDAGTPLEHIIDPRFFGNVSQRFKPGDTILAFPRDGAWYAELLVWDAGQNWANVSLKGRLERPDFASAPGVLSDFEVRRDPIEGYQAVRKSTGAKLKGGFTNAEDARRWFLDHQRALKA